jgi:MacB-like periplasmic core domain
MRVFASLRSVVSALFRRTLVENELEEELHAHIQDRANDLERSGIPGAEAERRARLEFGGYQKFKEECREAQGAQFLDTLIQDLRYGMRVLRKNPGFTAVAVLTLALGIGANTAVFSVVEAALLRPLPFHEPDRIVQILETTAGLPYTSASGEDYLDWESQNRTLEGSSITTWTQNYNASGAGQPETVSVVRAEANFFSVIGTQPFIGSSFAAGADQAGHDHVAVLSYGFWQRHFGGSAGAVGKAVKLNDQPYTVVGVMPRWFAYPQTTDVWIPIDKTVAGTSARGNYSYRVLGRLKDGVTIEQAQSDLSAISARLAQLYADTNRDKGVRVVPLKTRITESSKWLCAGLWGRVEGASRANCSRKAFCFRSRALHWASRPHRGA